MATRNYTSRRLTPLAVHVEWTNLTFSGLDDGQPFSLLGGQDRSVSVTGTFGTGGSLTLEGNNAIDPATGVWLPLTDPQGNALTFTSARIEQVAENVLWVRPRVTAGDANTALAVRMLSGG